ncbi:DNA cytosine methyltransferase [Desulfovibrio sp. OttesenSCG-928-A18]|nr:DNA cytosine methyltransferase [Desulfovibrio sp. OttesenSCG-928-A18]
MGIIVDLFAGGGGASQGIFEALGRHPDAAVNHSPQAVAIHAANHPDTEHWCQDVWSVDPSWVGCGYPADLLWASPDCTHHSKAKGGPPRRDERRRDLAMVISTKWIPALKPRVLILENVEEFLDWGPCDCNGVPIEHAKGENFRAFVNAIRRRGYRVQWRELVACDYGAPTTRKRLLLIARNDGLPIVWPTPTHGAPDSPEVLSGRLLPWRTAAEIIDWSLPCPSIFASSREIWEQYGLRAVRPLADNTMHRIFKGLQRYVLDAADPFIVNSADATAAFLAKHYSGVTGQDCRSPIGTITTIDHHSLVTPFLVGAGGPKYSAKPVSASIPLGTVLPENHRALIAPILTSYYGPKGDNDCRARPLTGQLPTQTTANRFALVAAFLGKYNGKTAAGYPLGAPLDTCTSKDHFSLNSAFLVKYNGSDQDPRLEEPLHTVTTKPRFGLVSVAVAGEIYAIADIGMRMLTPRELLRAQGFPDTYIIDMAGGKKVPKDAQVAMIGNSVCPPLARALVAANYVETRPEELWSARMGMPLFRYGGATERIAERSVVQ